jgi:AraC-like DNA-binding protein
MKHEFFDKIILLIDVASIHGQLNFALLKLGFNVVSINGDEYSNYIKTNVDFIFVDVKNTGLKALSNIYQQRERFGYYFYYPPIIAITDMQDDQKAKLFELGAADYISSPFIFSELQQRVMPRYLASSTTDSSADEKYFSNLLPLISTDEPTPFISKNATVICDFELAEKIAVFLQNQLSKEISLVDLSIQMGTNRNKLSQAFKASYGMTIFSWLREQRLLFAVNLLESTTLSILEISQQVGYPDSNNFSTAFKRNFRLSPYQYRKSQYLNSAANKETRVPNKGFSQSY